MDTISDRLTLWEGRIGPEFAASITPSGALRLWMVKHLTDETGESEETVEAAIDEWLEHTQRDDTDPPVPNSPSLGDRIEMLMERRRQLEH